jgi:hypothetical protein
MKTELFQNGFVLIVLTVGTGCGSDSKDADSEHQNENSCASTAECFPDVDKSALSGPALCLTDVTDGYCVHECTSDLDCCSVAGTCFVTMDFICAPLVSGSDTRYCLVACDDIQDVDAGEEEIYCRSVHPDFVCRSIYADSENFGVCVPN